MTIAYRWKKGKQKRVTPGLILAAGFALMILAGSLLLMLPVCTASGESMGFFKGLFTATSAVCITGFTLLETGAELSFAGQLIVMLLFQVGGLGFMIFAALAMGLIGKKFSLKGRLVLGEALSRTNMQGLGREALYILGMTLLIELAGAAALGLRFIPHYGVGKGLWVSLFTSVSAFCNAGFDVFGLFSGVTAFRTDSLILITLMVLGQLGSLGFVVIFDLLNLRKRALSVQSKMVLLMNAFLLLAGALLIFFSERNNPLTFAAGDMSTADKWLNAFMQSVCCRSAGFFTFPQGDMMPASKLISVLLMFIGGAPASMGGGIKMTTMAVCLLTIGSVCAGKENVTAFGKEISGQTVKRAVVLFFIALGFTFAVTVFILILENGKGFDAMNLCYEAAALVTTSGLSAVGTSNLSFASQLLMIPMMFLGRVGPLTLAMALSQRSYDRSRERIRHPEEDILIG